MGKITKIALAGNPNAGKTTLFNALTGSNQFVGNWPGVTVEKKEGQLKDHSDVKIVDMPGVYSLSPYTLEEVVARNYLIEESPDVILNIVDGTNLERNLYLTTQLADLGIPLVVALNMLDIARKRGDKIDIEKLAGELGCGVIEISALKGDGIRQAADMALKASKEVSGALLCPFSRDIEALIEKIENTICIRIPKEHRRWFAIKVFERDEEIINKLGISEKTMKIVDGEIKRIEEAKGEDGASVIIYERYNHIDSIMKKCFDKGHQKELSVSEKIDVIVTNRVLALPIFALIMFLVYYISVTSIGGWATSRTKDFIFGSGGTLFGVWEFRGINAIVEGWLDAVNCHVWMQNLIVDGIIGGVGSVLGFIPQLMVLFLFLAFLEGCGYMARIAFVMDRAFRKFGLSGKSFIPFLIGTGCGVPGIMASRTIENESERKMTIITTTFMPCSAKLPIIALMAGVVFGGASWVAPSAYFLGIGAIIVSGIILKKSKLFAENTGTFLMELPPYHMPSPESIIRVMWERSWSFIKKAGTIILLSSVLLWLLMNLGYDHGLRAADNLNDSILSDLGGFLAWIFTPLGFGNWQSTVAVFTGMIAKENIVGTFGVYFGGLDMQTGEGTQYLNQMNYLFTPLSAYSFMTFNLLCAPCVAAIGAIRREMNNARWTLLAIGYQCTFAYCVSLIIYQFGCMFSGDGNTIGVVAASTILFAGIYLILRPGSENTRLAYV